MTKLNKLFLSLFLLLGVAAFGQTSLTQTSLSAKTDNQSTSVVVASATGITAPGTGSTATMLYVIDGPGVGEAMFVNGVSGTTIQVQRGASGTAAVAHISGAIVLAGPPSAFYDNTQEPSGACTNGQGLFAYTPVVNIHSGNQWLCSSVVGQIVPGFWNSDGPAVVTTAVASAATATPSGPLFHVTGSTAITTIGSAVGMGGTATSAIGAPFCVIPDNATVAGFTAGNNIALSSTFVVSKIECMTFDGTNKKYVPSY